MRTQTTAALVGAVALAIAAMLYGAIKFLSHKSAFTGEGDELHAYFRDATGLVDKSRIQVAGLTIGKIQGRTLARNPRTGAVSAKVTIAIDPGVALYANAAVFKKSASLLGEFYLEIDPGTPDSIVHGKSVVNRRLHSGDEILDVHEATSIDEITRQTAAVMEQVHETMPVLKDILTDVRALTRGPVSETLTTLNKTIQANADSVTQLITRLNSIAGDVKEVTGQNGPKVNEIVDNVRSVTDGLKGLLGKNPGEVEQTGENIRSSIEKLQSSVDKLDKVMSNSEQITGKIAKGEGTVGRLINDDTVVEEIESVAEGVGSIVRPLARLQTIVALRSEYNYLANTLKTYLSLQFQTRPDKYYLIELIDDPRGLRRQEFIALQTSDQGDRFVNKVTVSDAFRFSFQFAKRINFATFRFGIKESTGGIGTDLHFLDDTLSLSLDLFDFRSNTQPRLKALLAWEFFKRLYVVAGIDDALNPDTNSKNGAGGGRDYFVGAQLKFNDEDLKSLFAVGGGAIAGSTR